MNGSRAYIPRLLVFLAICCGACGHAVREIRPIEMERVIDPFGSYIQVDDSILMRMRTCFGVRFIDVTFTRVELDAGAWHIAGCVDAGAKRLPARDVRVMLGQMPWCCPEMLLSGEIPSVRVAGPTMRCTTGADGAFEMRAPADSASCLVVGSPGDLMDVYELWRLMPER